jgi:hypothetical protein
VEKNQRLCRQEHFLRSNKANLNNGFLFEGMKKQP